MINSATLAAFWTVRQRRRYRRMRAGQIVVEINRIHADAAGACLRHKVKALWRMEALGVAWGRRNLPVAALVDHVNKAALPIVKVGLGAGLVAQYGFESWICNDPWRAEGVGHMFALRHHPVVAWMLGMPRHDIPPRLFRHLDLKECDRISYGMDRMAQLLGGTGNSPGAAFADDILALYRGQQVSASSPASAFIKEVWP